MEGLKVYPVESKARLSAFIKLSWKIYKRDKNWVRPLLIQLKDTFNPKKNPYYSHAEVQLFIVERDGEPVGRIAAHINHAHNEFHKDTVGFFGFFECMPDYEAAQMLFDNVTEWLEKRGITVLRGPMNFSTNDECGLLVEGFDKPPFVMMTYNPPYYKEFLEQYGFQKSKDLLAYFVDYDRIPSMLENMMNRLKRRKRFIIRKVNPKKLEQEISTMFELYNQAWQHNWGFVPMDKKEFSHTAQQLKQIADFDMVLIAEVDGTPVGF
ncbi:MAG: N-acetyltransferase, partial [Candidatus Cloacimonadia bacterium]